MPEARMGFQCKWCGGDELRHHVVDLTSQGPPFGVVELHCTRCDALVLGGFTTRPVTYDDLLVALARSHGEVSHYELGFLLSRPDTQVLAALMDLRSAGLVKCLDLDLEDREVGEPDGRCVVAGTLENMRTRAWFDDTYFDLKQDIAESSSLDGRARHPWVPTDLLKSWSNSIGFLAQQ